MSQIHSPHDSGDTAAIDAKAPSSLTPAQSLRQFFMPSIRHKIIVPYLLLTLVTTIMGIFIITRLIASSIEERFTNQLLEAGRVASDGIVRWENRHLEALRAMTQTEGVPEALQAGNVVDLRERLEVLAYNHNLDTFIVLDADGNVIMRMDAVREFNAEVIDNYTLSRGGNLSELSIVKPVLNGETDALGDKYAGLAQQENQVMLFTASPVYSFTDGEEAGDPVGAILAGTSLRRLLTHLKTESLADIVIYTEPGRPLGSTIADWDADEQYQVLIIDEATYEQAISQPEKTPLSSGQPLTLFQREFRMAYTPFIVRGRSVGVLAVLLPNNFVVRTIATSRRTFIIVFTIATGMVVVIGGIVARRILTPIFQLAELAEAVTAGELDRRASISSSDEIGALAARFNHMTDWLQNSLEQVAAENARIHAIVDGIGDGIVVYDTKGERILENQAAKELLEIHTLEDEMRLKALAMAVTTGAPMRLELGDRTLSIVSSQVITEQEELVGSVLLLRDVTKEAIAERTKDSFLDQIGHEFRTPLTSIVGYAQILTTSSDKLSPERYEQAVHTIHDNAEHMRKVVDQLIEMTALHGGDFALRREEVNFGQFVKARLEQWQDELNRVNLSTTFINETDNLVVNLDQKRINKALDAVLDNAVMFSPLGGDLKIHLWRDNQKACLSVSDPGAGISEKDLPYVWSRFYRGTPIDKTGNVIDVRGMGQGLNVVKTIIEAHGGQVDIESEPHKGTTIFIYLPIK